MIGTHRLLSKDADFKDLGLVIVDEEQRFGVAAKERLKQKKTTIDSLTLSATPIPRTLQMGLSGLRDMALLTVGFAIGARSMELAHLDVSDITPHERGIQVHVRKTKGKASAKTSAKKPAAKKASAKKPAAKKEAA